MYVHVYMYMCNVNKYLLNIWRVKHVLPYYFSLLVEHLIHSLLIVQHSVRLSTKLSTRSDSTKQDNPPGETAYLFLAPINTYYWPNVVPVFC